MNNDRIAEVYKGEIWSEVAQERARRRVNWMVSQAVGERVLDVGCSQGIASILLGREGYIVTGIDIQESRIEYARQDLGSESPATQDRVDFRLGDAAEAGFDDHSFDTVLLGEVLEHLVSPERILAEMGRIVKPGGRVVITTPFGILHHDDHKQTFFARDVLSLISSHFVVASVDIQDRYFRIVATPDSAGAPSPEAIEEALLDLSDATVAGIQTDLAAVRTDLLRTQREISRLEETIEQKDSELRKASETREELLESRAETREALLESRAEARELDKSIDRLKSQLSAAEARHMELLEENKDAARQIDRLESQLSAAEARHMELLEENKDAARQVARHRQEASKLEKSLEKRDEEIAELELRNWKLARELGLTKWKLQSMRARKWWRLGGVLGRARKAPWKITEAFGVLFGKSDLPERPKPLPRPQGATRKFKEKKPTGPERVWQPAPIPKRPIPAAVMADGWLLDGLRYECQVTPVSVDDWQTALQLESPRILVVAGAGIDDLTSAPGADRTEMLEAFRATGVRTVAWDTGQVLPSGDRLALADLFDVVCAASGDVMDAYRSKLGEERVHLAPLAVAPRLHNPTGGSARKGQVVALAESFGGETRSDFAELVEIAEGVGLQIVSELEFDESLSADIVSRAVISGDPISAVKGYRVALAGGAETGDVVSDDILRIAATNTPVIIPRNKGAEAMFGSSVLQPTSEREAARSLRALLHSDPMRARQSHLALRQVMREHTLGHRLDLMLNPKDAAGSSIREPISVVVPTNRPQRLDHLLSSVGRQTYPSIELVLVLHGIEVDDQEVHERAEAAGVDDLQIVRVSSDIVLGDVINRGFTEASHRLAAKMDDDDYYGDEYLADLADALEFSGADIVGKWAHFAYVEDANSMILRYGDYEHTYREVLAISTLLLDRAIFETVQFPSIPVGSGSIFLRAAAAEGARAYSADRFNYVYMRYADSAHHTYPISNLHLRSAELVCHGLNVDHATV